MAQILKIKIDQIEESPYQGRLLAFGKSTNDEDVDLKQLASNIQANGLLNPIIVRAIDNGYELIDGHRRLEAHRLLGHETIEAIIKEADDKAAQVMSIVSNLQRKNLNLIEKALAFKKVLDAGVFKDKKELSAAIGKDQTFVGDMLNALNMDKRILSDLQQNKSTNDVRLLRAIRKVEKVNEEGLSEKQWELYSRVLDEGLSRTQLVTLLKADKEGSQTQAKISMLPRRIEVNLPKVYTKAQRAEMEKELAEYLKNLLDKY